MGTQIQEEDVGNILIKVQEDIYHLKERFLLEQQDGKVDLQVLQDALMATENGLRTRTESLLHQMQNRVSSIGETAVPAVPDQEALQTQTKEQFQLALRKQIQDSRPIGKIAWQDARSQTNIRPNGQHELVQYIPFAHNSPGENFKRSSSYRILSNNPQNQMAREIANRKYGIELPYIQAKVNAKYPTDRIVKGSNVDRVTILPRTCQPERRLPSQQAPISEDDARKGLLNLIERGLIPPATEINFEPSPIRQSLVTIHNQTDKTLYFPADGTEPGFALSGYYLDENSASESGQQPNASRNTRKTDQLNQRRHSGPATVVDNEVPVNTREPSANKKVVRVNTANLDINLAKPVKPLTHNVNPPTTPTTNQNLTYRFAIQHGAIKSSSSDFVAFKQHYCLVWGSIVTVLKQMINFLNSYSVPVAFIDGDKLADLSIEYELESKPTEEELLYCIANKEEVEKLIRQPGRQYKGPDGQIKAATKIQSNWRCVQARRQYLDMRRKKWAAGVIAIRWILYVKMASVKRHLKVTRTKNLENYKTRCQNLAKNWGRIKSNRHVIIHLPSLGYSQKIRDDMYDINTLQNTQMSRLCDLKDSNVDLIYISPVPVSDDMLQYYTKLLSLKPISQTTANQSETTNDQEKPIAERYKIIVPEAIKCFPAHNMCLSTLLKYSPRALRRIKNMIKGRKAYIVPGVPHIDDLYVSDYLDVPILCAEPERAQLYSNKSGSKRVFTSAEVPVPPGEFDIYHRDQLFECLANLITLNLSVNKWLLKIDGEVRGRGIASLDVSKHLPCYNWALKERERYGLEKWSKKWAHDNACMRILKELPDALSSRAVLSNKVVYSTWDCFLGAFLSQGGVVEACPPSDSITNISVDVLIDPTGQVSLISSGDQIHEANPFTSWGLSVPQSSVDAKIINEYCSKISNACVQRQIMGYFTIDFVTFIDPITNKQELWATDLSICYSDNVALMQLALFASDGTFSEKSHTLTVPASLQKQQKRRRRNVDEKPENLNRYIAMSSNLHHSNMGVVHYSVFFQMCRAHGIGYDLKERQGTLFALIDSFNRENLSMISISDSLEGALETFGRNLFVIHQEISAPNMQGSSNFKSVIKEIEDIIGLTIENATKSDDLGLDSK